MAFIRSRSSIVVLAITLFVPITTANAEQAEPRFLADLTPMYTSLEPFKAPPGHVDYCNRYPNECKQQEPMNVHLDEYNRDLLVEINALVNTSVESMSDREFYAQEEWWEYPTKGYGDCEDYVLEKRRLLMAKGWPASALLMTFVETPNEDGVLEGHLVLTAVTDRGDLILDNVEKEVMPWQYSPHSLVARQAADDLAKWQVVDDIREAELFTAVDIDYD